MDLYGDKILYQTIKLKPHWKQFVVSHLPQCCLAVLLYVIAGIFDVREHVIVQLASFAFVCYLVYKVVYWNCMEYVVTDEQIIFSHGVFSHATDYMELYRVVDYQEHRTFIQQLFRVKTVIISSGDRNMPVLELLGIKENNKVIQYIRIRVEYNKRSKGIYEITNR